MTAGCVATTRHWAARVVLAFVVGGGLGCGGEARSARHRDGSARMADTLAVLYAQALANPESNRFLNRERADRLQAELAKHTGTDAVISRYQLAEERLKAGQTREAIGELEGLMRD